MKIVRIIARLNIGGPAIHVVLLARGLQNRGHQTQLLVGPVPPTEGDMDYFAARYNVPCTCIPELVRPLSPWKDLIAFWKIYRILRREKPDVVHTHTSKAGTLGRAAAKLAGAPAIFHTFHGSVFDGYFSPARTRLFLAIERFLARFTDRVITVSPSLKKQLSDSYRITSPDKIEVIRLGFDLKDFFKISESGTRLTKAKNSNRVVVGWVGRFTKIKDPLRFVELAALLKSSRLPIRFLMVGDGQLRAEVEARISQFSLSSDFTLAGWQDDMPKTYSEMDVLVSTSVNEGTPVTVIEAMATGCPFVAPNIGGLADLTTGIANPGENFDVYSNGVLVHSRDVESLAQAISLLISDSELRERMGSAGHEFAMISFGQDRLIQDIESLYLRFLKSENADQSESLWSRTPSKG